MAKNIQKNKNKNQARDLFSDPYSESKLKDNKIQGRTLGAVIIVAILLVVFSVWWLNQQLTEPFEIKSDDADNSNSRQLTDILNTNSGQLPVIEELRDKDTDQDGLSDYDELYIFATSPYIADSDSDNIDDSTEVDQGTDPNCPAGIDCDRPSANVNTAVSTNSNAAGLEGLQPEETVTTDTESITPEELRQVLRNSGASEEELNQLTDDQLMEAYNAVLEQEVANLNTNATSTSNLSANSDISYEDLVNLTPDEIRQLMIAGGVPEETLNQVDDATLQQIYLDSLSENLSAE